MKLAWQMEQVVIRSRAANLVFVFYLFAEATIMLQYAMSCRSWMGSMRSYRHDL
jgi:hypothetical protein